MEGGSIRRLDTIHCRPGRSVIFDTVIRDIRTPEDTTDLLVVEQDDAIDVLLVLRLQFA